MQRTTSSDHHHQAINVRELIFFFFLSFLVTLLVLATQFSNSTSSSSPEKAGFASLNETLVTSNVTPSSTTTRSPENDIEEDFDIVWKKPASLLNQHQQHQDSTEKEFILPFSKLKRKTSSSSSSPCRIVIADEKTQIGNIENCAILLLFRDESKKDKDILKRQLRQESVWTELFPIIEANSNSNKNVVSDIIDTKKFEYLLVIDLRFSKRFHLSAQAPSPVFLFERFSSSSPSIDFVGIPLSNWESKALDCSIKLTNTMLFEPRLFAVKLITKKKKQNENIADLLEKYIRLTEKRVEERSCSLTHDILSNEGIVFTSMASYFASSPEERGDMCSGSDRSITNYFEDFVS